MAFRKEKRPMLKMQESFQVAITMSRLDMAKAHRSMRLEGGKPKVG